MLRLRALREPVDKANAVGIMSRKASLFFGVVLITLLPEIAVAEKRLVPFNREIRKVGIVGQSVIVAGEGFLTSIPTQSFQESNVSWIQQNDSHTFSVLATDNTSSSFMTCYESVGEAHCGKCSSHRCEGFSPAPKFVLDGNASWGSSYFTVVSSSNTGRNPHREYLCRWRLPISSRPTNVNISVKEDWQYKVLHSFRTYSTIYILSDVRDLSNEKNYTAFSQMLFREKEFNEIFVNTSCGNPILAFGSITKNGISGMFFIGETKKLCLVMWKAVKYNIEPITKRFNKNGNIRNGFLVKETIKNPVTEIQGFKNTLWTNESVTGGLFLDQSNPTSLLFLTTQQGRILKYSFVNDIISFKYGMAVSGPASKVILSAAGNPYLYGHVERADSKSEAFQIEIHDCGHHNSCFRCFSGDPYCRWFPFEQKCRFGAESEKHQVRNKNLCPKVASVSPAALPLAQSQPIFVKVTSVNITAAGRQLWCEFRLQEADKSPELIKAEPTADNEVKCFSPKWNFQSQKLYFDATVSIFLGKNALVEKTGMMKFYNCRHFRSCISCQQNHNMEGVAYKCVWQLTSSQCALPTSNAKGESCPQFDDWNSLKKSLRLPNKASRNITLKGSRLNETGSGLKCYIGNRQFPFTVVNQTTALCKVSQTDFGFSNDELEKTEILTIVSKESNETIEAKDGKPMKITVYSCEGNNCSTCLLKREEGDFCTATPSNWKCKPGESTGIVFPNCGKEPNIDNIDPRSGPIEGGTRVTIKGTWLGLNKAQLAGKVLLANVPCLISAVTIPLRSFECITQPSNQSTSGGVKVWNKASLVMKFSFESLFAPVDIFPSFCFIGFPSAFNVTLRNYHIGRRRNISIAGVNLTNLAKRTGQSDVYTIKCPSTAKEGKGRIVVTVDRAKKQSEKDFEFLPAPSLNLKAPQTFESIQSGGVQLLFPASNAFRLYEASLEIVSLSGPTLCKRTAAGILCEAPSVGKEFNELRSMKLRTLPDVNFTRGRQLRIKYFPNPDFVKFSTLPISKEYTIELWATEKSNLKRGASFVDYKVMLGDKECNVTVLDEALLRCSVLGLSKEERERKTEIKVRIGSFLNYTLGVVRFVECRNPWPEIVFPIIATFLFLAIACFLGFLLYRRRRDNLQKKYLEELDKRMEEEHFAAANASRNAFVEMQTAMEDMQLLDTNAELPYRDFEDFMVAVLLPNSAENAVALAEFEVGVKSGPVALPTPEMVSRFNYQLMSEKPFLLTLIRTFDVSTKLADKSLIAAALSVVLADRMEYYYEVLRELFHHIVKTNVEERKTDALTLLFRRSESLMEKMFSNWLTICLYTHLRNSDTGKKLYIVFKALGKFLNMGPVDAIRCRAKNVLSEDVLLSEEVDFSVITLRGSLKNEDGQLDPVELQVLSCDTIGQVKEKIIEALSPHRPFSMRPAAEDYVLQWQRSTGADGSNAFFLHLETQLTSTSNKLPVIGDLNAKDALVGAHLVLVRLNQAGKMSMGGSMSSFASEADDSTNLLAKDSFGEHIHLCQSNATTTQTVISKDFCLPHLLKTRHVVHTYIEDLFKSIFNIDIMEPPPPYVEHIFGVIDDAVNEVPHDRPMMAHVWKSNSYILRVWVNLLKNPEFLFDVNKSPVVNANLSVIAQALMDACSYNPKPTSQKGLSSTKLVFLRDIEQYRKWVTEFYSKLETKKTLPSDQDMSMLYNTMQNTCKFSGDIMFRATRFLLMKSRDLKPKILDSIDNSQWFHTNEERQNFKDRVEAILGSTCADTTL